MSLTDPPLPHETPERLQLQADLFTEAERAARWNLTDYVFGVQNRIGKNGIREWRAILLDQDGVIRNSAAWTTDRNFAAHEAGELFDTEQTAQAERIFADDYNHG